MAVNRLSRWNPAVPPANPAWYNRKEMSILLHWMHMTPQRPIALTGAKGCGKTSLITEACHRANRKMIRVNGHRDMTAQDLIGVWNLQQDKTLVWQDGPVPAAMRSGAVLLIDEFDRIPSGSLSVLQAVLEGAPLTIPETGEVIYPEKGFAIAACCNSVGTTSNGYTATFTVDEATLDRFEIVMRITFPSAGEIKQIIALHVPEISNDDLNKVVEYHMMLTKAALDFEALREVPSLRRAIALARWLASYRSNGKVDPVHMACICYTDRLDPAEGSAVATIADKIFAKSADAKHGAAGSGEATA